MWGYSFIRKIGNSWYPLKGFSIASLNDVEEEPLLSNNSDPDLSRRYINLDLIFIATAFVSYIATLLVVACLMTFADFRPPKEFLYALISPAAAYTVPFGFFTKAVVSRFYPPSPS